MYGLRDAGQCFDLRVEEVMKALKYTQGVFCPCIYVHQTKKARATRYGDGFVVLATRAAAKNFKEELSRSLIVKDRGTLSPRSDCGDREEISILNRIVRWVSTYDGRGRVEYEADPRHIEVLAAQLGLQMDSKTHVLFQDSASRQTRGPSSTRRGRRSSGRPPCGRPTWRRAAPSSSSAQRRSRGG